MAGVCDSRLDTAYLLYHGVMLVLCVLCVKLYIFFIMLNHTYCYLFNEALHFMDSFRFGKNVFLNIHLTNFS